jgi:hypothetical protein
VVKETVLETVWVPVSSNPLTVTGLAPGAPAISMLVKWKTALLNSMDAVVSVGTAALGVDGAIGEVLLALKLLQVKPS